MRIMAIDLGDARTGLAVSDMLGLLCGEAWTVEEWDMERLSRRISEEAAKRGGWKFKTVLNRSKAMFPAGYTPEVIS